MRVRRARTAAMAPGSRLARFLKRRSADRHDQRGSSESGTGPEGKGASIDFVSMDAPSSFLEPARANRAGRKETVMFTDREIELVRASWARVAADPDAAAALFYGKLFEAAPSVKPLFSSDMTEQGRKLMQMIGVAVNNMDRIEQIIPAVQDLGVRHVSYGAEPPHYPVVGAVLLDTLATALGDAFGDDTRAAWTKTYGALSHVMTDAASKAA